MLNKNEKNILTGLLDINHNNHNFKFFVENLQKLDKTFKGNKIGDKEESFLLGENADINKSEKNEKFVNNIDAVINEVPENIKSNK